MIERVKAYIDREIGLNPHATVFIALSGGADSTALLLIMKELGYRLQALHCNFHLRGEESNRDQAFAEELCRQNAVPLSVRHFETEAYAKQHGVSIEMAARDLRYSWFREELERFKIQDSKCNTEPTDAFVAVAHHRDDQAETLLLNLLRGTGLRGLAGMWPKNGSVVRPLLCMSREEILAFLKTKEQSYVTDSTNSERAYLRNRIRLDVIPLLREINPAAVEHLCLAQDNVRDSLPYYKKGVEAAFKEFNITKEYFPLRALDYCHSALFHEWIAGKGFNSDQEEEMFSAAKSEVGKMWFSKTHKVLRDREALLLTEIRSPGAKNLPDIRQEVVSCIGETGPYVAYFDADLVTQPIEVRLVRKGDVFVPFGMKGMKLVSDFLTDIKLNRFEKAETYVATQGDNIIWLIGHRSDNRYRVTDTTKRILKLSLHSGQG
ncbi:MAG: tRNA lysidine(34) synthetase TilS [Bacteroidaceae bacterium]|nr:tRNA lysidine(34) synthetase TilS [Bacteroidaceae bacterium]MBQ9169298.1 tRNA lysidine(34) synthetase TilS [Bacteroidaceae bacterium]